MRHCHFLKSTCDIWRLDIKGLIWGILDALNLPYPALPTGPTLALILKHEPHLGLHVQNIASKHFLLP